jgi:hypothetical protein
VPSSGNSSVPAELQTDFGLWLIKLCVVRGCVFIVRPPSAYPLALVYFCETSLVVQWSEFLTTDHEIPGLIPGSTMGIFP